MAEEVKPIKTERIDNSDGSYMLKIAYNIPINGYKSRIDNFNNENKYTKSQFFEDSRYKKLVGTIVYEYDDNGNSLRTYKYEYPNVYGWSSAREIFNNENKFIEGKFYIDKYFSDLGLSKKSEYQQNGERIDYLIYSKPQKITNFEYSSLKEKYNSKNEVLSAIFYSDNNFKTIVAYEREIYNNLGKKEVFMRYKIPDIANHLSIITEIIDDNTTIEKAFIDNNFKEIDSICKIHYQSKNITQSDYIFSNSPENKYFTRLISSTSDNKTIAIELYEDNNFKNLLSKESYKYYDETVITLKTYGNNMSSNYTEIKKYDKNNNLIYKKQYKFKGILAQILFWFAR